MLKSENILSKKVLSMEESQTLAMSKLSRELVKKGKKIINLSIGEPDFGTPDHIKEAGKKAIDEGFTHYTPVSGLDTLREAIVKKLKRDNGLDYNQNQIVVSTGAKQSIANIVLALINPGDEVLLPAPYWVSYYAIIKMVGGVPVPVDTDVDSDYKVNYKKLKAKVSAKTKLLLFSSPCNPSGSVYFESELKEISDFLLEEPNIIALSDEIYELINYHSEHHSLAQFKQTKEQVVVVNGVSKGFSMTGWRIGYMAGPAWLANACDKIQGQFTSGACAISQKAAEEALSTSYKPSKEMCEAFLERRDLMFKGLKEIEGVRIKKPMGAFFLFPDISSFFGKSYKNTDINTSEDMVYYLLNNANVATVDGDAFGNKDCIRLSYATDINTLKTALKDIKIALEQLK